MPDDLSPLPSDELLHSPWGDERMPWKETWYFSLVDVDSGVHLAMHMTVSADRAPDTRVSIGMRGSGEESVVVRHENGHNSDTSIGNTLAWLEVVNLSWDGDHQLWWRARAPEFEFDVLVRGVHLAPFFDTMFPGANPTGQQGHSYSHTEQVIRGEGVVRWHGGSDQQISAFGWRDRGWGRRQNTVSFGTGYDLVAGILPNGSAFAFTGMRNVEHAADAPLPVYGFLTDATGAVPAVGGIYFKESTSFPLRLGLEFADGRRVDGELVHSISTLGVSFHDAAPEKGSIAVGARDYYSMMQDPSGARFPVFSNEGHTLRANVTSGVRFFGVDERVGPS